MRLCSQASASLRWARYSSALLGVAAGGARVVEDTLHGDSARRRTRRSRPASRPRPRSPRRDPSLLGRTDSTPVNVMIKYDFDATASYKGGVAGLAATSPRVTGKTLKDNAAAVSAYEQHADAGRRPITAAVKKAVPGAKIGTESYARPTAASPATVPANQIADLLDGPRRRRGPEGHARPAARRQHRRSSARRPSGRRSAARATRARTSIVGVIDTGIWPEHPMLVAAARLPRRPAAVRGCQFGDGSDAAHLGPPFACNNKLIGAYAFTAHVHGEHRRRMRTSSATTTTQRLLRPRLRGSRHAHDDDGRRRLRRLGRRSTASSAARSAASLPAPT